MRKFFVLFGLCVLVSGVGSAASAQEGAAKPRPVVPEGAPTDPHRAFLHQHLRAEAKGTKSCFACHAAPDRPAAQVQPKPAKAATLLARVQVVRGDGSVVAAPQLLLQAGGTAAVSFQERQVDYHLRLTGATEAAGQHQVELTAAKTAADGSKSAFSNARLAVLSGQESSLETNGYRFTITIAAH